MVKEKKLPSKKRVESRGWSDGIIITHADGTKTELWGQKALKHQQKNKK